MKEGGLLGITKQQRNQSSPLPSPTLYYIHLTYTWVGIAPPAGSEVKRRADMIE